MKRVVENNLDEAIPREEREEITHIGYSRGMKNKNRRETHK